MCRIKPRGTPFRLLHGYYPSFHDGMLRHLVTEEQPNGCTKLQERPEKQLKKNKEYGRPDMMPNTLQPSPI
ncbi:unnamed protein product [Macrosiphum euphorbiae]|uniref:Uncharacterized protein n=1 Tax=Macrosiphum euphorbiae TaxID=13131 RepID=A0AAV0VS85_9HEMI|nr:unnamed protein product [Macrosiphum euphorbiae]